MKMPRRWQVYSNGRRNMVVPSEDRVTTFKQGLSMTMHPSMHEQFGWLGQPAFKTARRVTVIALCIVMLAWALDVLNGSLAFVSFIAAFGIVSGARFVLPLVLGHVGYGYSGEVVAQDWRGALSTVKPGRNAESEEIP